MTTVFPIGLLLRSFALRSHDSIVPIPDPTKRTSRVGRLLREGGGE